MWPEKDVKRRQRGDGGWVITMMECRLRAGEGGFYPASEVATTFRLPGERPAAYSVLIVFGPCVRNSCRDTGAA